MPVKNYDVASALLQIQPDSQHLVKDNDTDQVTYHVWAGQPPTEAEIDAAGVIVENRNAAKKTEQDAARADIASGKASGLPAIENRVEAIEIVLGLRSNVT